MPETRPFTLLMAIYAKEKATFLKTALESVLVNQSVLPAEIVMVEDGPLTEELYSVLEHFKSIFPQWVSVKLDTNKGLGMALNEALPLCTYDWVARMDSDDISLEDRFEKQWEYIEKNPKWDVVGGAVAEFDIDLMQPRYIRRCPEDVSDSIKFRSPVNHPTVFFKKEAVINAGGYLHCPFMEDYYLWIRMFINGAQITSIPDVIYLFRMNFQTQKRRGGRMYAKSDRFIQKYLFKNKQISYFRYCFNIVVRVGSRFLPSSFRSILYCTFLREKYSPKV